VARTRLQVPELDQLCDDCQSRNTPLEADNNAAHATPPKRPRQVVLVAFAAKAYGGLGRLEPDLRESGVAFRNRKYFRTNCPSRATSGLLQTRHAISRATVSGPASALTTW
jgi:hypothetical protein